MAFGKKTDRAGLQAVLELKNVDYSKDPEIQQLYTRLVNGRSHRLYNIFVFKITVVVPLQSSTYMHRFLESLIIPPLVSFY